MMLSEESKMRNQRKISPNLSLQTGLVVEGDVPGLVRGNKLLKFKFWSQMLVKQLLIQQFIGPADHKEQMILQVLVPDTPSNQVSGHVKSFHYADLYTYEFVMN